MKKISIIVPVYNTYEYLEKCLNSLIEQKKVNFDYEVIIVNDGSPDNSEEIILKFKNRYPNIIRYVKKENGGSSSARNEGLKVAEGEYVIFIDSDDYVESNLLETFEKNISDSDLLIFGYNEVYEKKIIKNIFNSCRKLDSNECYKLVFEEDSIKGYVWNKIFKREIIVKNKMVFDEKIKYIEDLPFVIEYLSKCKSVVIINSALYNYVQRENSLIHSTFNTNKLSSLISFEKMIKLLKEKNENALAIVYYNYYETCYELSVRIRKSDKFVNYKKEYKFLRNEMSKTLKKFIFKNIKLKYKIKSIIKFLLYDVIFFIKHKVVK